MGIPAFYRWLVERYPRSVVDAVAEDNARGCGVDASKPNPNGLEFDNFYLDMNAIIHPCFHPDGSAAPESFEDVFKAVFKYIDALFAIVRPRKLLYMAIDGVAPRAKMNQQRSRRFRTAKDAADEASKTETSKRDYSREGLESKEKKLDSNIITPGTEFMELLSSALHYYVHLKMNSGPGWRGIKVILSDASVPGEGEHKVISYIRLQRNLPGFDPNTRHCMYGLDADLIMLALATHEIHFSILREDVHRALPKEKDSLQGLTMPSNGEGYVKLFENYISNQRFQFLHIWILRDYLSHELRIPDPKVKVDLDRLIDDFVFMCLFVGNDFLPHVPSLEISEGAIDLLMMVYKKEFSLMGGYLTNSCEVDLDRVEHFIQALGAYESAIFRKRAQAQKEWETRLRCCTSNTNSKGVKGSTKLLVEMRSAVDEVKLGEEGWKKRYYCEKFEVVNDEEIQGVQKHAVSKYVEGICWVMHYYYQGICSWQWFYPYHYAPFASDFNGLQQFEISFNLGKPFKPFDQLMAVLPAASAQALPSSYRKLMTDPLSPIIDFYPTDFELDMNGKRHAWQAVCKLPFIDELHLLMEIRKVEHTLTDEEKRRNSLSVDVLFVHSSHQLSTKIFSFCKRNKNNPKLLKAKVKRKIDPAFSDGMNGYICISTKPVQPAEINSPVDGMESITENNVVSVFYKPPAFHPHIPRVPKGVVMHANSVNKNDIQPAPILWHEKTALVQQRRLQRRLPAKSVSGPHLAKLAHQLVLQKCTTEVGKKRKGDWPEHNNTMNRKKRKIKIRNKLRKLN
ncbi:OLC1v1020998C1 [Oldenlandia corymbosa var. corymbosa]|uniref:5'-3' exoribonuclease n=1 Tax=Oldenlandia corymbosa var. corymbosa TaxID=529605 RepID=A0AAV1BUQ7_OLDCO|nr:OLC1v1020998C1 [Oldenlandia corymbosa var. corymbosa]